MSMLDEPEKDYSDGRTKQAFKDSTDINKILAKAARGESISHLQRHGAIYGDFTDVDDLLHAHERLERGKSIFAELPAEVRREFGNDLGAFFRFVNDPANVDRLSELLPALAAPGRQLPVLNAAPVEPVVAPAEAPPSEPAPTS